METLKPNWIDELEQRLDHIRGHHQLGHEIGAGSKCLKCEDACPGLELHFWRKQCRNCKCKKEDHDVPPNDDGRLRFEILIKGSRGARNESLKRVLEFNLPTELKPTDPKSLRFDWAPPVSNELAAEYMKLLPSSKMPISGSVGAAYRNKQLEYQIPLQDISPNIRHQLTTSEEKNQFENYLQNLRDNVVGQGIVQRVCQRNELTHSTSHVPLQPAQFSKELQRNQERDQISNEATDKENANTAQCKTMIGGKKEYPSILMQKLKNASLNNINNPSESQNSLPIDSSKSKLATQEPIPPFQKGNIPFQMPYCKKGPVPFLKYKDNNSPMPPVNPNLLEGGSLDNVFNASKPKGFAHVEPPSSKPVQSSLSSISYAKNLIDSTENTGIRIPNTTTPINKSAHVPSSDKVSIQSNDLNNPVHDYNLHNNPSHDHNLQNNPLYDCNLQNNPSHDLNLQNNPSHDLDLQNNPSYGYNPQSNPSYDYNLQYGFDSHPSGYDPASFDSSNEKGGLQDLLRRSDEANSNFPSDGQSLVVDNELDCYQCENNIPFGTVAVVTDRAGEHAAWHPNCFICCVCKELLVDLVYFFHDKQIFCGRHYAEINSIPRCFACDELIFVSQYTVADEKAYHLQHFCCADCDLELAGNQFLVFEGHVYCLPCYHNSHAKKCGTCNNTIRADEEGMHLSDNHWHRKPACFCCFYCHESLIGRRFVLKNNKPFCSGKCFEMYTIPAKSEQYLGQQTSL